MKTYDFSGPVLTITEIAMLDFDGKSPMTCGRLLANQIANQTSGPPVKLVSWAQQLWKTNELTVNDADKQLVTEMIELSMPTLAVFFKNQILECFAKEKS